MNIGITGLWRHRQTLRVLVQRDLAVKYQKTVMGYFWSLLEPMGMAAIYWFIFGVVYGGSTRAGVPHDVSYGLYVVTGIFAWMWASSAMSESTSSLTSQTSLITTMRVPREVFPVARVFARFAEFLAGIPIIVVFAIFGGGTFGWHLVFLPLAVIIQATLLTGISFILASLNVLYRDVQRFMRLATRILFYSIPTIYPLYRVLHAQSMPNWVKAVYQINPYVGIMQLHHEAWIPGLNLLNWKMVVTSAAISVVVLFLGRWVFYRLEPSVLKEL
ncbi:ABC transporter permease [Stackebrandtia sp.]|uniref:ABC transporter permease n=1 Tax=Stackebrandtia sp. TaxID=2023065 RepID=UPI0032C24ACB